MRAAGLLIRFGAPRRWALIATAPFSPLSRRGAQGLFSRDPQIAAGRQRCGDWAWRAWFVTGMMIVGAAFELARPSTFDHGARVPLWLVAVSGLLVGLGTRASNGCTSGHGLCGMSRLSKRSIVATVVFFACGVATATISGAILRSS